jgi:hypothetical protein
MTVGLVIIAAIGAVVLVPRLSGKSASAPAPGTIVLKVGGQYRTTMTFPAVANWCPVTRVAAIEAVSVDTGFAIALRESNAVSKGVHPVFTPEMAPQAPKPSATAALRWLRLTDTSVVAYRATSGHVDIDEANGVVSGSLLLHLFNSVGRDSLVIEGRFAGLKVVAMAAGCT